MEQDYIAKTFAGLEDVLVKELEEIGANNVEAIKRGVKFSGDTELLFKANYLCRTAISILKPVGFFQAKDQETLYDEVKKLDWTKVFNLDQTFIVNGNVFHSELSHSHFVALKTKDAIVDQFRDKTGKRPWVGLEDADIYIDVHINQNNCTVSLNSSGESLHRRGYRISADKAPLNEVLAAGMVKLTGWKGDTDLYDPMCGSATIPIEAAMIAMNIPAGHYRKHYAFMSWADHNEELWTKVKSEADAEMGELECNIYASDRSEKAVGIAKRNLKNAGLHKDIDLSVKYFDTVKPEGEVGMLIFNPPYGKRLEERGEFIDFYKKIGDTLKQNFSGYVAWIITAAFEEAKFIGLRPSARIPLYNGPLETKFLKYEMYDGSKRETYGERPYEKKDFRKGGDGERRPFKRRDGDEKKDYRKRDDSDKRPFRKREDGERKPFSRREDGEKKPFKLRDSEGRKDYRKREDGDKKDFRSRGGGDKKPFRRREEGERKSYGRRDDGEQKPFKRRDDDGRKDFRKRDEGKRDAPGSSDKFSQKDKDQKPKESGRKPRPRTGSKPKDES